MSHIKTLFWIVVVLCALHLRVDAQSVPSHPYEGATHTYVVNGLTPGTVYAFHISSTEDGVGILNDGTTQEFDFLGEANGTVATGQSTASLPVTWNNGAAQHLYYLWIVLNTPGGCSTSRYLIITPQVNIFDLLSENIPTDNTESCPATASTDGFNPLASEYQAGNTMLQFKVRREGSKRGWMFEPSITIKPEWNLDVAIVSVKSNKGCAYVADASKLYTVPASEDEVIVSVVVKNFEGTEQVVTLEIINQKEEKTLLNDSNPENDKVHHHITVMPVISDLEEL
jgi:hypothetical protein